MYQGIYMSPVKTFMPLFCTLCWFETKIKARYYSLLYLFIDLQFVTN